jgi:hypothetical protein
MTAPAPNTTGCEHCDNRLRRYKFGSKWYHRVRKERDALPEFVSCARKVARDEE